MTPLRILPWALWVALLLFTAATYSALPAEIPQQLDFAGRVTRSTPRGWLSWMMLPLISGLILGVLTVLRASLPKRPQHFNFPEKERFLRLPPRYRALVIPHMQATLDFTSVFLVLTMGGVQYTLWRTALGERTDGLELMIPLGSVIVLPLLLILTSRVNTATEDAERKWKADGSPTA